MKRILLVLWLAAGAVVLAAPEPFADPPTYTPNAVIPPPNAAAISHSQPKPVQEYDYTPRINRPEPPPQPVPDKEKIVAQFRELYAKQNKPKLLVYIKEQTNQQTMCREIEDAFGFPFRQVGGVFMDQKIATLINSAVLHEKAEAGSPQARDAEAIKKNADIVFELLLDERSFPIHDMADGHEVTLPVMTATAIRLGDSQIVAQVTSMGLFGLDSKDPKTNLTSIMVQMTPSEIAQEMAFALMRDLNHSWSPETK